MIWANLIHLSYNMWADRDGPECSLEHVSAQPYLRFDIDLWDELLDRMADAGLNMVVLDLGDAVRYESHPEIAVADAWSVKQLKEELAKARGKGLEPIPKLNFSTAHDTWLGAYSRCVSTDAYYRVCSDLIEEVSAIFDKPRLFHIGMDEETAEHQRRYEYCVIRQFDLWWHDFLFLVDQVEKNGSRAWIWSDYVWNHPEVFFEKMPHSVLQSNWYYSDQFTPEIAYVKPYHDLEEHSYEQIPTGSNWASDKNFESTVRYCRSIIPPERLMGFLQTPWKPTLTSCRETHLRAIEQVKRAKQWFDEQ